MKNLIACGVVVLSTCLSGAALAGTDSGFYIGASVGQSAADVRVNNVSIEDENTGYKILAGFNFGVVPLIDLAVEVDYRDFGEFEDSNTGINSGITSYDLFALGGLNFGLGGVFAKLGYCNGDVEGLSQQQDSSDSYTAYGVGAKLQFTSLAVRAEYENFNLDNFDDLSMFSVGGTFTF